MSAKMNPPVCSDCGHFFDPTDKRSFERRDGDSRLCPLCATLMLRTQHHYAVWNGCQGVFEVRWTYAEAEQLLNEHYAGVGTCVAPVLVMVAPDDQAYQFERFPEHGRFVDEAERNRLWAEDIRRDQAFSSARPDPLSSTSPTP